jgi:hypothetical protein
MDRLVGALTLVAVLREDPADSVHNQEGDASMERTMGLRRAPYALAALLMLAWVVPTYAQTDGMERRDDRQDNRAGSRAVKQACKAGDEKTRAECRQGKRDTKQDGRQGGDEGKTDAAPAANPAQ